MADVDLSVAVTESGVDRAVAQLNALKKAGLQTQASLDAVGTAGQKTMAAITAASSSTLVAQRRMTGFSAAMADAGKATSTLNRELAAQESLYKKQAKLDPNSSAAQRLTRAGGSQGLQGGMTLALQIENRDLSRNASLVRDRNTVLQEQAQAERARGAAAAATGNLMQARWERELSAMKPIEAAQARLARSTQELAAAQRALAVLPQSGLRGTEYIDAQARARNNLAEAERNQLSAEQDLAGAKRPESAGDSFRYLILAGLAQQATQAVIGLGAATLTASMQIERSFADVDRTFEGTDSELKSLQNTLTELSTTKPVSIIDLSQIATLGNQLGVASTDIESFTKVIAEYTAVSGQSAEDAATAFGRISNLTGIAASEYSNLASAITYVARTTVATESTIQNTSKEISALSAGAGFSADAIVGLAGALSSLAIPPERARGALSLYFGALNEAVAEGGPKLEAFATLTGKTAEQLDKMVRDNKGQEVFTAFIQGLSELDTVAKTTALDTLGLSTIRVDQTMRALAQNVPLVTSSFEGANRAYVENTEISNQYSKIQATLNSKFNEFQNAVQNVAGAIGDKFAPAAKDALVVLTNLLVGLQKFSNTPIGAAFIKLAGATAVVIGALAALIGVLALTKASMVVLGFAVKGLGWTAATKGLTGWIAALILGDRATRTSAASMTGLRAALAGTTVASRAAAVGMGIFKVALPIIALTAAIALIDQLTQNINKAVNPSSQLTDDLTGLKEALMTDNPGVMAKAVRDVATSSGYSISAVSDFNQSIMTAIEIQKHAEDALKSTNGAINEQSFALGDVSKSWIEEALKSQSAIKDIIDGRDFWEQVWEDFSTPGSPLGVLTGNTGSADSFISRDSFYEMLKADLDINELSQIFHEDGEEAAMAAYEKWREGAINANPDLTIPTSKFGASVLPGILKSVDASFSEAAVQAALDSGSIEESGVVALAAAGDFDEIGNYVGDAVTSGQAFAVTFSGVTSTLDEFRSSITSALGELVGFDSVLERAQSAAKTLAEENGTDLVPVDAAAFGKALGEANNEAVDFYSKITQLAATGSTSFASQLAELGPEASGILGSALDDPAGLANLEAGARFAAFLASDAFTSVLETQMVESNQAYARIFQQTGDLGVVKDYIASQIAGTGEEWERQWAIDHPNFPLNITPNLVDPSDEQISMWEQVNSGRLTITPTITTGGSDPLRNTQTITDTLTGASLVVPASLDGQALSDSVAEWQSDQSASPAELEAKINGGGLSDSVNEWVAAQGPIKISATIVPTNSLGSVFGNTVGVGTVIKKAEGGPVLRRANGGIIRGPGTPTSDSIPLWASRDEYMQQASAVKYWGVDFMDSLNSKQLPTSFVNLLGLAASRNGGAERTTSVAITQVNPVVRDSLKQLREDSENVAAGIW